MTDLPIYVVLADGDFDNVECGTKEANKHVNDLKKMGFDARKIRARDWEHAEELEERYS